MMPGPIFVPGTQIHDDPKLAGHRLICELRKTSTVLYGIFVELVRQRYSKAMPYLNGTPDVSWDKDPTKSQIWIDTELNWNSGVAHPEFRPAIYVKLGNVQYMSKYGSIEAPVNTNLKDAIYEYNRIGTGSVTFVHVAETAGAACILNDNTRVYLNDFCQQIADDMCFTKFHEAAATPISVSEKESKERYMATTTFAFEFDETWGVKLESPIIKQIDVGTLQDLGKYGILTKRKVMPDSSSKGHS